jgi:HK97 gp10 family phage protein
MADLKHVKGLAQLESFLLELPAKIERNILRGALRAGARLIQKQAQANVSRRSGKTAASIKVGTRAEGGRVIAYVRVKDHKGAWLEYGTRPHAIKPKNRKALAIGGNVVEQVSHPGARPHRFLRPAFDGQADAALVAVAGYIRERLATEHGLDTADVKIGEEA